MKTQSDIELSSRLTKISRKIKTLTASIPSNPSSHGDFVAKAGIDVEIAELQAEQVTIGTELLVRDKAAAARKLKHLDDATLKGIENAKELREKLTEFASKLSLVTNGLAGEYAEILKLSVGLRQTNNLMLSSNMPHVCNLLIEPNNVHKIVKTQLLKTFGANSVNVFLPQNGGELPDIIEVVKEITDES